MEAETRQASRLAELESRLVGLETETASARAEATEKKRQAWSAQMKVAELERQFKDEKTERKRE